MIRVVIAVDPSGCEGDEDTRSDEIGIVVVGLGTDGKGYLLHDYSGHYGPSTWAKIVADAFINHLADSVVAEANYGGAMVKHTIATANDKIPVKMVTATRGKVVRATPVAALYDVKAQKIKHVGFFPEIEEQMCGFYPDGYKGLKSPDRCDALIWAITELFPGLVKMILDPEHAWRPPEILRRSNRASQYQNNGTPGLPKGRRR
jgi:phage terminase large subunit-like protein